ncbi:phospholipase [soil metagenome]
MNLHRLVREGTGPTLILLHGLGANEEDLFDLGHLAPEDWRIVSLRGPTRYGSGFAWFGIEWTETGLNIDLEGAKRAAELVIQEAAAYDFPIVMGFSQGAMLVWLALTMDAPWRAGAMFSGASLVDGPAPEAVYTLVVHGRNDPVIPIEFGRELSRLQGHMSDYLETDDAHGIGLQAQKYFQKWLQGVP